MWTGLLAALAGGGGPPGSGPGGHAGSLPEGDAVCVMQITPPAGGEGKDLVAKLGALRSARAAARRGGPGGGHLGPAPVPAAPRAGCAAPRGGAGAARLDALPPHALWEVWARLPRASRRQLRAASVALHRDASRTVASLALTASDLGEAADEQLARVHSLFPGLNALHLHLAAMSSDELAAALGGLGRGGALPHLHTFALDARLRGDGLATLARFLAACSNNMRALSLPGQRGAAPADQRRLAALLEGLLGLERLDLGAAPSSGDAAGASNALSPRVMRRVMRLHGLRALACNASAVPDEQLAGLAELRSLRALNLSAAGSGEALAAALACLRQLSSLELQHPALTGEQLVGRLGGLGQLQVLALGLCPRVDDEIMPEVARLRRLERLTVPFALTAAHLRMLSRLPRLSELMAWRGVELELLGPAHDPLRGVTRLVAHSIQGQGRPVGAWFPALASVALKRCSDTAALSLRGASGLTALLAGDCAALTDEGLACLRDLRGLQKLQLDNAGQVTDAGFSLLFSATMPALHSVSLAGCGSVTDAGLQALTGSCRRLQSVSLAGCRHLTDATLRRLAHCEHLTAVSLKACRGFTSEGVAALAAAPHIRSVAVAGCPGVRASQVRARPGVRLTITDRA
ncbi:FBXL2 [Scenedesmus sp. PABB004]|nr:FBXL2 [Scenedesmus sp. PABB004]